VEDNDLRMEMKRRRWRVGGLMRLLSMVEYTGV